MGARRVLIIDDDPDMARFLPRYFRESGFDVTFWPKYHGIEEIKNKGYNLIVLDQRLKGELSGEDIATELYRDEETRNIKKIILTGFPGDIDESKLISKGVISKIVSKDPITLKEKLKEVSSQI